MSDVRIQGTEYEVVGKHYLHGVPVFLVEPVDVWLAVREAIQRVADEFISMSKDEEAEL